MSVKELALLKNSRIDASIKEMVNPKDNLQD
jgi:hypothetical protein